MLPKRKASLFPETIYSTTKILASFDEKPKIKTEREREKRKTKQKPRFREKSK